jgi:hypothetical protein
MIRRAGVRTPALVKKVAPDYLQKSPGTGTATGFCVCGHVGKYEEQVMATNRKTESSLPVFIPLPEAARK